VGAKKEKRKGGGRPGQTANAGKDQGSGRKETAKGEGGKTSHHDELKKKGHCNWRRNGPSRERGGGAIKKTGPRQSEKGEPRKKARAKGSKMARWAWLCIETD